MLFLKCLVKGFKIRSNKLLNLLVGHFGPPTIGPSFKSLVSEMVIRSLYCSLIFDVFKDLYSESVSNGLDFVIKAFIFSHYRLVWF